MLFRGHYEHSIDAKGRTSLPARFRHALEGDQRLVLAPGLRDPCLDVYPMQAWEELERKVAARPRLDRDIVLFRRRYISAAVECDLDKHGRVLVPAHLRSHAAMTKEAGDKEVLWAGVGTNMELWSRSRWDQAQALSEEDLDRWTQAVAEKLEL